jgi:hypothetical protein
LTIRNGQFAIDNSQLTIRNGQNPISKFQIPKSKFLPIAIGTPNSIQPIYLYLKANPNTKVRQYTAGGIDKRT